MLGYENRNMGGCSSSITNCDCNYTPQGMNAAFGYNTASELAQDINCECSSNQEMCCNERRETRQEMLNNIRCLNFAIVELAEYLDTHPDDRKAICLHREYCQQYRELTDSYQKVYGPLTIHFPCNKWRWLEEPWPWEGGMC